MKHFLFLLLFSVVGIYGCRTIDGSYYESFGAGWGGANYYFHKDGTFSYRSRYDVGGDTGCGNYRVMMDRIKFEFDSTKAVFVPPATFTFLNREADDSSRALVVKVFDESGIELPGAIVSVKYGSLTMAGQTSIEGSTRFMLDRYIDSLMLNVNCFGFHKTDTVISARMIQLVNIRLIMSWEGWTSTVDSGTVWKFRYRKNRFGVIFLNKTTYSYDYDDDYRRDFVRRRQTRTLLPE